MYMCTYIYIYIYIYIHVHKHKDVYLHVCSPMCIYTSNDKHVYTHVLHSVNSGAEMSAFAISKFWSRNECFCTRKFWSSFYTQ